MTGATSRRLLRYARNDKLRHREAPWVVRLRRQITAPFALPVSELQHLQHRVRQVINIAGVNPRKINPGRTQHIDSVIVP